MPAVIPFIPLIAAGIAGTAAVASSKISSNTAKRTANQAIDLQREQEAERRREWDIQTAAAKKQWDTEQANLAPYRAARLQVLRKRGYDVPDVQPTPPDYSAGPPVGWKPGDPIPGASSGAPKTGITPKIGGGTDWGGIGGVGLGALGAGVGSLASYYANKQPKTEVAGPPRSMISSGSISSPSSGTNLTSGLSNWSDWSNYYGAKQYGVPDQNYYGE